MKNNKQCKCSTCKDFFEKTVVFVQRKYNGKEYYRCRACHTKMIKKYRQTEKGKIATLAAVKRSIAKYPEKHKARTLLNTALVKGLIKKDLCKCGSNNVEAHHEDYSKPLLVDWMCRTCHSNLHRTK